MFAAYRLFSFECDLSSLFSILTPCSQGFPTDVRRIDISDTLPGLTDAQRKHIREKALNDAIRLSSIQSLSATSPLSRTSSSLAFMSCEPPEALLNAASKDLPSTLPTPPRHTHNPNSPPTVRMRSMWENTEKLSIHTSRSSSTTSHADMCEKLARAGDHPPRNQESKGLNESFRTLNLEFDWEDKTVSPRTISLSEGFEVADTTGGAHVQPVRVRSKVVARVVAATCMADSSGSDSDGDIDDEGGEYDVEKSRLVKI
jgi:hypothetical protein